MRSCGVGHTGLEKFCGFMNIPKPVTKNSYSSLSHHIRDSVKLVAEASMTAASDEIKSNEMKTDVGVSVDGTWQKRGFASLNGVVVAISTTNRNILDVEAMSRYCNVCASKNDLKRTNRDEYEAWKLLHKPDCKADYEGSAPNMESTGALRIFERSVKKHGLRFTNFYGDGDSKSFKTVENVYPGISVETFECIGHYQKRVGNRLRKLRSKTKGLGGKNKTTKKLNVTDGGVKKKKEVVKQRLTDVVIDKLQNYFGIALRSNIGNLKKMQDAILASMFHVASSEKDNYHTYCPKTPDKFI